MEQRSMKRLEGRRALVTAAGQGIGRAITLRFASEGARVVAVDIDEAALSSLERDGIRIACADATDPQAMQDVLALDDGADVVANCVGWVHHGTLLDCPPDAWRRSFAINVDSVYTLTRLALPGMLERGHGCFVNIASLAGQRGALNRAAYSATKAAIVGLTKAVAADYAGRGIRCNAICPAMIDTPSLADRIAATPDPVATRNLFISRHPVGRLGTADEVAALAAYLASDEGGFMTGAALILDGGAAI
jgi:2-keto-3-deoxy-L-fuconate dehydrogenase